MSTRRQPYGSFADWSPEKVALWARGALARPDLRILDTETPGQAWAGGTDEIVEICIIDREGTPLLNTLVWPEDGRMHPDAAAKSGITDELLAEAPCFSELAGQVAEQLQGKAVVIYNAAYDAPLLQEAFGSCGQAIPTYEVRCVMLAYHAFCGRAPSERWWGLERACRYEGISMTNVHRALGDCLATLALLQRMAERAGNSHLH